MELLRDMDDPGVRQEGKKDDPGIPVVLESKEVFKI